MGRVFTPQEFKEGRIPVLQGYQNAMHMLRGGLTELYERGIIYGANIHGSNFHSDGGIGSDIDILVIMNSGEAEEHLRKLNIRVSDTTYVPIEFVPVLKHMAERGYHLLDGLYVTYMKDFCKDGIVGNNPFNVVLSRPGWANPRQEVLERWETQMVKLSKQRASLLLKYDEKHCAFLEKLIRQPVYSAVDMLRLRRGCFPSEDSKLLSKRECCNLYAQEFPELAVRELFLVLDMRSRYRQFLAGPVRTLDEYIGLLDEIDSVYPQARNIIETNFEFLLNTS